MRSFHQLVMDERHQGSPSSVLWTSPIFDRLLASATTLSYILIADGVLAGTTTVTVKRQESPDEVTWKDKSPTLISAQTLTVGATNVFKASESASAPTSGYGRLEVRVNGAPANARVRIWATGRGPRPDVHRPLAGERGRHQGFGWGGRLGAADAGPP